MKKTNIPAPLHSVAEGNIVTTANEIYDDGLNKKQNVINQETKNGLDDRYTKEESYSKEEVNNIISRTPETDVIVIDVPSESQSDIAAWLDANTPSGTDPETGRSVRANKLYRVPGPTNTTYSEWAWDGTAYIMLANKNYGIDDEPTPDSNNLITSNAAYDIELKAIQSYVDLRDRVVMTPDSIEDGKFFYSDGSIRNHSDYEIRRYPVEARKVYAFSGKYVDADIPYIAWADENGDIIRVESYTGPNTQYTNKAIIAPTGAVYVLQNRPKTTLGIQYFYFYSLNDSVSQELLIKNSPIIRYSLVGLGTIVSGKYYESEEFEREGYRYLIFPVEGEKMYSFSGTFPAMVNLHFISWIDANGKFIAFDEHQGSMTDMVSYINEPVISPKGAAFAYINQRQGYYSYRQDTIFMKIEKPENMPIVEMQLALGNLSVKQRVLTPVDVVHEKFYYYDGERENSRFGYKKYSVTPDSLYAFSSRFGGDTDIPFVLWLDVNGNLIGIEKYGYTEPGEILVEKDRILLAPHNAAYLILNCRDLLTYSYDEACVKEVGTVNDFDSDIQELRRAVSEHNVLTPFLIETGFITKTGELNENSSYKVRHFHVEGGGQYLFSGAAGQGTYGFFFVMWFDENDEVIGGAVDTGYIKDALNVTVVAPPNAVTAKVSISNTYADRLSFVEIGNIINSSEIEGGGSGESAKKLMKVVVRNLEGNYGSPNFYIRTKYNNEKDIIINHWANNNGLVSFDNTYVGDNSLSDNELMTSAYLVSSHNDSTGPIRAYTQYWHLFAQHGYPVPYFTNSMGMTAADVGALWRDQLDREYRIGKVTAERVYLLPVIYQDSNGHYTRDWHSTATSTAITSLTYVSGGQSGAYTSPINLSSYSQEQLHPIMSHTNRAWLADELEITEPGTYYCNEFKVSESQIGYDPATIQNWFGESGVDISGAQPMAEFTASYCYKGAQCAVNTTFHVLRECKGTYSGTQQQFFFDKGDYRAMFMIPKAKARNGIDYSRPFNSPSSSSSSASFYRRASDLIDVNDPVDRQIGFLHKPNTNDYLVGMAAGLSLISGDTIKSKRNINRPVDSQLLSFSPSNTNKFYVYATASDVFENGYYPVGYFKEINYYVSYFDPAENVGQVYWYKDGNRYIIYAHCQSQQSVLPIQVPAFMDGLKLSVVEKTTDAELLSDTISNGKFFVNYNSNDANYIVLTAE